MTHISRKKLAPDIEKIVDDALLSTFAQVKPEEVDGLLSTLLTKTERIMLAKRLATITMLQNKVPQQTIARILKVTVQTVYRTSLELDQKGDSAFKMASIKTLADKIVEVANAIPNFSYSNQYRKIRGLSGR